MREINFKQHLMLEVILTKNVSLIKSLSETFVFEQFL